MTPPEEKLIARSPRASCKELADGSGAVVLHLESGAYHGLDKVGTLIWNLLEEERLFNDLLEELRRLVEDPPLELAYDVETFLGELEKRDLVVRR